MRTVIVDYCRTPFHRAHRGDARGDGPAACLHPTGGVPWLRARRAHLDPARRSARVETTGVRLPLVHGNEETPISASGSHPPGSVMLNLVVTSSHPLGPFQRVSSARMSATSRFVPTGWWHALTTTKEADESRDGCDEPKAAAWRQLNVVELLFPVCTTCVGHSALTSTVRICAFASRSAKAETCAKICAIPLTSLEPG